MRLPAPSTLARVGQAVAYAAVATVAAGTLSACGGTVRRAAAQAPSRPPPVRGLDPCGAPRAARRIAPSVLGIGADSDGDGVTDSCEQSLAERYAPVVFHSSAEEYALANVDWYLARTELWYFDERCLPDLNKWFIYHPSQTELARQRFTGGCGYTDTVYSWGTRSELKQRTFYLRNVMGYEAYGTDDTSAWTTYFHAYPNLEGRGTNGGVTIQYWRFYPGYDDGITGGSYSGDWEEVMIALDQTLRPSSLDFIRRGDFDRRIPSEVEWEGTHFHVYSEPNTHESGATASRIHSVNCGGDDVTIDPNDRCTSIRQETWSGGRVFPCLNLDQRFCSDTGRSGLPGGALLNVGEKTAPMNGQDFIRYSGLWGAPGGLGIAGFRDGWWGPAFFGTQVDQTGYIFAWCLGMYRDAAAVKQECYPTATSR